MSPNFTPNLARRRLIFSSLASATLIACAGSSNDNNTDADSPTVNPSGIRRPLMSVQTAAQALVNAGLVGTVLASVNTTVQTSALSAVGLCRKDGASKIKLTHLFNIASLTKAMSASVIASVVEQGLLSWGTRLADVMPELADSMNPAYASVTLEQLLAHRAGIVVIDGLDSDMQSFLSSLPAEPPANTDTLVGKRRYLAAWLLQQQPPQGIVPGHDFLYSNASYALAATMAEAVTGKSFESLFEEQIVSKLGVKGQWRMTSQPITGDQPVGHTGPANALQTYTPSEQDTSAEPWLSTIAPAGYWACSAIDYAHWLRWHVLALRGQTTPLPQAYVQRLMALELGQYFCGWGCGSFNETKILEHTGYVEGFMSRAGLDPQGRHCAFGLSNTSDMDENSNSWVWSLMAQGLSHAYPGYTPAPRRSKNINT